MSQSHNTIGDAELDTLFRTARSQNKWQDKPVSNALLMAIYDLMRWGPTGANTCPARFYFVTSQEAKARLKPLLSEGNREKTMGAPAIAIIGYDLDFPLTLPKLFPHAPGIMDGLIGKTEVLHTMGLRNSSLQGAYFMMAARSLGLDCGPMSGFDNDGVDKEFFAGTNIKSNFICAIGYGDPAGVFPRLPRLSFDEACKIL